MDILADIFHHGLIVDDIAAAMAQIGTASGTEWSEVRAFDPLPVWTPEAGRGEALLKVAYARSGPLRLELVEAMPGTPYDSLRAIDRSHIGVWVDDVGDGVEHLCAQGWRLLVAGASPRHRHGSMAYLAREGGPVIELVGRELRPMMEAWWATRG
ncbi:MAG: VOC family protein [Novosphingobium sp.]